MSYNIIVDPAQREAKAEQERQEEQARLDALETEVIENKPTIPEKYRGKSAEDLVQIAQDLERDRSRLGNELGDLRKRQTELERQVMTKPEERRQISADEILDNPEDAVEALVKQSPTIKGIRETSNRVDELERNLQKDAFSKNYPGFQKDLQNPAFIEWINKSPLRVALATAADQFDFTAATSLWSMWQERLELIEATKDTKKEEKKLEREKKLQDGTLESGTGNTTESKKIFRRSEIIHLKAQANLGDRKAESIVSDKSWQKEVQLAYAEGRVR